MAQLSKGAIAGIAGAVALIFGGLFYWSQNSVVELKGVGNDDEGWKSVNNPSNNNFSNTGLTNIVGDDDNSEKDYDNIFGGKKSRKKRRNKTRRSRSKSKRRPKK